MRVVLLGFAARLAAQSINAERLEGLERILGEMRAVDVKQALLDEHFREGVDEDGGGRVGRDLPDLSAFSLPRATAELRRQRR